MNGAMILFFMLLVIAAFVYGTKKKYAAAFGCGTAGLVALLLGLYHAPTPAVADTKPTAAPASTPAPVFYRGTAPKEVIAKLGKPCNDSTIKMDGEKARVLSYCYGDSTDAVRVAYTFTKNKLSEDPQFFDEGTQTVDGMLTDKEGSNSGSSSADTSNNETTAEAKPEPTPDRHAERVEYHQFWNRTTGALAMAYVFIEYASRSVASGDMVEASKVLSRAEEFADQAKDAATSGVPSKFDNDNIGLNLFTASRKLGEAISKAKSFLDDGKPSEMADAQDDAAAAREYVDEATHAAREVYIGMGGKGSDLEAMDSQAKGVLAAFDALMGNN